MSQRSASEIRSSIEQTRNELVAAVDGLRAEVERVTDWRAQILEHREKAITAAAVAGFVIGGGLTVLRFRRRR